MPPAPLLTPATVRALLREHGLRPRRGLGQHFLADPNTARRIVRLAGVERGDRVLEIGPGLGSLTLALLDAGARVLAVEMDERLSAVLEHVASDDANLRVVTADALRVDFGVLFASEIGGRWRCVSNLPYNVATPVVVRVLEGVPRIRDLLVMVQREVGERLVAGPGGRAYGAVSVRVAYHAHAKISGVVPPSVFVPAPKVESALVRLARRDTPPVDVPSVPRLFELVQAGFAHRRKMLRGALRPLLGARTVDVLSRAGIDPGARAEALGLVAWAALSRAEAES